MKTRGRFIFIACAILSACTGAPARAGQPYCAFDDEYGKIERVDKSATGSLKIDYDRLREPPSPEFLKEVRANPAYRVDSYLTLNNGKAFMNGSGFVCDASTDTLGHFLGCLQQQADAIPAGRTKDAIKDLKHQFESTINPALKAAGASGYEKSEKSWQDFFDDIQAGFYNGNPKAATKVNAYTYGMKHVLGACSTSSGCSDAAKQAMIDYYQAIHGTVVPIAINKLAQRTRQKLGLNSRIYFQACPEGGRDDFESVAAEKARLEAERLAFLFTDKEGNTCDNAIPRVTCDSATGSELDNPIPSPSIPTTQVFRAMIHDDMAEFVKDNYISGWNALALSNLSGKDLSEAQARLEKATACSLGDPDADRIAKTMLDLETTPAEPANQFDEVALAAAQKEAHLNGAIAAACVKKMVPDFALLQVKHGKGLKVASSINDEVGAYVDDAKKSMTPDERKRFEMAADTADFAQTGLYMVPGLGQMMPLFKVIYTSAVKTPLLSLADAYAEKNKCAGMYVPGDPIYNECVASFALMTQIGAETSDYLREYPTLAIPDEQYTTGYVGYQRANTYLPPDVRSIVDHYVPRDGAPNCLQQARAELKKRGEDAQVTYNDEVFDSKQTQKLLKDIEKQLPKFCYRAGRELEAQGMEMSPALLGRYFSCDKDTADPQGRNRFFNCDTRKHYAWVICGDNIELKKHSKDGGDAEAVGQLISTLMEATAVLGPASSVGLGTLKNIAHAGTEDGFMAAVDASKALIHPAAFGGGMGAASAGAMLFAQGMPPTSLGFKDALERERARFAAGMGSTEEVASAQHALEEFKKQNEELLSNHPVWKAALDGAVTGLLMAGMSGDHAAPPEHVATESYGKLFDGASNSDPRLAPVERALRPLVEKSVEEANPKLKPADVHAMPSNDLARLANEPHESAMSIALGPEGQRLDLSHQGLSHAAQHFGTAGEHFTGSMVEKWKTPEQMFQDPQVRSALDEIGRYTSRGHEVPAATQERLRAHGVSITEYDPKTGRLVVSFHYNEAIGRNSVVQLGPNGAPRVEARGPFGGMPVVVGESGPAHDVHLVFAAKNGKYTLVTVFAGDYTPPQLPKDLALLVAGKTPAEAGALIARWYDAESAKPEAQRSATLKFWKKAELEKVGAYWSDHALVTTADAYAKAAPPTHAATLRTIQDRIRTARIRAGFENQGALDNAAKSLTPTRAQLLEQAHEVGLGSRDANGVARPFTQAEITRKIRILTGEGGWDLKNPRERAQLKALLATGVAGDDERVLATQVNTSENIFIWNGWYETIPGEPDVLIAPNGQKVLTPAGIQVAEKSLRAKIQGLSRTREPLLHLTTAERIYLFHYANDELARQVPMNAMLLPAPSLQVEEAAQSVRSPSLKKLLLVPELDPDSIADSVLRPSQKLGQNGSHGPDYVVGHANEVSKVAQGDQALQILLRRYRGAPTEPSREEALHAIGEHLYVAGSKANALPREFPKGGGSIEQIGRTPYMRALGFSPAPGGHDMVWKLGDKDFVTLDQHWARTDGYGSPDGPVQYKVYVRLSQADIAAHLPEIAKLIDHPGEPYQLKVAYGPEDMTRPDRMVAHFKTPDAALAFSRAIERFASSHGLEPTGEVPFSGSVGRFTSVGMDLYGQSSRARLTAALAEALAMPGKNLEAKLHEMGFASDFTPLKIKALLPETRGPPSIDPEAPTLRSPGDNPAYRFARGQSMLRRRPDLQSALSGIERDATPAQRQAIERAHLVGQGREGAYTPAELKQKADILKKAGFNEKQREALLRGGVSGDEARMKAGLVDLRIDPGPHDDPKVVTGKATIEGRRDVPVHIKRIYDPESGAQPTTNLNEEGAREVADTNRAHDAAKRLGLRVWVPEAFHHVENGRALVVSETFTNGKELYDSLVRADRYHEQPPRISFEDWRNFRAEIERLHSQGVAHGDLAKNILFTQDTSGRTHFGVIDWDGRIKSNGDTAELFIERYELRWRKQHPGVPFDGKVANEIRAEAENALLKEFIDNDRTDLENIEGRLFPNSNQRGAGATQVGFDDKGRNSYEARLKQFVGKPADQVAPIVLRNGTEIRGRLLEVKRQGDQLHLEIERADGARVSIPEHEIDAGASVKVLNEVQKAAKDRGKPPAAPRAPPPPPSPAWTPPVDFKYGYVRPSNPLVPLLQPAAGSDHFRIPSLAHDLTALSRKLPNFDAFVADFQAKNGRAPTLPEATAFVIERRTELANDLGKLVEKYRDHPAIAESFEKARKEVEVTAKKNKEITKALSGREHLPLDPHNPDHLSLLHNALGKTDGEVGELLVMPLLDHVVGRGMHFQPPPRGPPTALSAQELRMSEHLDAAVKKFTQQIENDPARAEALKNEYPIMFKKIEAQTLRASAESRKKALNDVASWVKNKEIDLVRELPSGRTAWVEVKNYPHVLSVADIQNAPHGGKPIFMQAREAVELRRFLGLDSSVELQIVAVQGFTPEAAALLRSIGVEPLGPTGANP